jgi:hypothetical protein
MSNTTINNAVLDIFGNLTGVRANVTTLTATGQVNALGNVVAPFFVGNGSALTGVTAAMSIGPVFYMFRSNNQTFASSTSVTGGNINYDGITFDPLSACNVSTGRFTVPQSGYYQFNTSTTFPSIPGSGTIEIRLVKNTTQPIAILSGIYAFSTEPIDTRTTYAGAALVNLTVGDIINVRVFNQGGNNTLAVFGNSSTMFTRFSGEYLGA